MSMPFYVAPEQMMKDRADYARKGIARGRALVAIRYTEGIAIVAENASETLRKVSEIYDRIAFAGVGKYNEFDQLRIAGVRHADLKGFNYSRHDVDALSLANSYAQMLGQVFTHEMKPMEVEILVAEVGLELAAVAERPLTVGMACGAEAERGAADDARGRALHASLPGGGPSRPRADRGRDARTAHARRSGGQADPPLVLELPHAAALRSPRRAPAGRGRARGRSDRADAGPSDADEAPRDPRGGRDAAPGLGQGGSGGAELRPLPATTS